MAANEYYNPAGGYGHSPSRLHPAEYSGLAGNPYTTHHDPYALNSQQSLVSDNSDPFSVPGRVPEHDQYADDIPLKSHAQPPNAPPPNWMQQPTQYPPAPVDQPFPGPMAEAGRQGMRGRGRRRRGCFRKKIPWVTYILSTAQIVVFIVELVKSAQLTGSPIETKPTFNPMIGPSPYVQINMGARFDPCMKNVEGVQNANDTISWPCPNSTSSVASCTLSELCGFNGVPNPHVGGSVHDSPAPDQWFRFIIPMFLHGGFVHIGFNMIVQLTMGVDVERMVGWWRYALVYVASGIWGFVLGGNYAGEGMSSTGCSGCLFGILALYVLDLLYTFKERQSPWVELIVMIVGVGISFVLGLLPGLDNFAHIGGFIMGLALGLCILRSPNALRERIGLARNPYVAMSGGAGPEDENKTNHIGVVDFFKARRTRSTTDDTSGPLGFFRGRKPLWWAWWLVRVGALVAVLIGFILLIVDFYKYPKSNCSWCYRLSCLPIKNWCDEGKLQFNQNQ
ncbi:hypothetical protein MPDQ_001720 [Monascus purpureus]|uniref:Rhomboid-type serine protease n=1 Tax=Monascus purpureus TaxID=5098 RepID=A0A507QLX4_MONPU|nr:hypothetical protein MPDQ_001720 [Monascus purpureus]BDD55267.1 hypothetical protein MAP00_000805 [Monascus purpureus]